jgi:hypothetical protein
MTKNWKTLRCSYNRPETSWARGGVCSCPNRRCRPELAIFGTILSSKIMVLGLRLRWIMSLPDSRCRKCNPSQISLIILRRVSQLSSQDLSAEIKTKYSFRYLHIHSVSHRMVCTQEVFLHKSRSYTHNNCWLLIRLALLPKNPFR